MPRYLFETAALSTSQYADIVAVAGRRLPEVAVQARHSVHANHQESDVWICRASNETELQRWAAAVDLDLRCLRRIDATSVASQPRRSTS